MKKFYALTIALAIALDRLVKALTLQFLAGNASVPLWEGVFQLSYVENFGAAFGMMQNQFTLFYIITALLVLVLVYALFIKRPASKLEGIAMSMVLGGALGNFYDRVAYGFVVDTFDFCLIHFPVFNVADICLTVGAGLWMLAVLLIEVRERREKAHGNADTDAGQ